MYLQMSVFISVHKKRVWWLSCCLLITACDTVPVKNTSGQHTSSKQEIAGAKHTHSNKQPTIPLNCTKTLLSPAKFRDTEQEVLVQESSPIYKNQPAEIKWTTITLQTEPARFPVETVPAQYRETTETIPALRERTEIIGDNATYKSVTKLVTTQEAHTRWKPDCIADDPQHCLEQVPTKLASIQQQIVDKPARTYQKPFPEKVVTVKRKILVKPGKGNGKPIPAKYQTLKIGHITKNWAIHSEQLPTRYTKVPIKQKIRPERLRPMSVLCTDDATSQHILPIQRRLKQLGYSLSETGKLDPATRHATLKFQRDNDLSLGAITLETLRKLEVVQQPAQ